MIFLRLIIISYLALNYVIRISAEETNKIVGGKQVKSRKFSRYVVSVRFGDFVTYYHSRCGGSILTERTVLTAGHCVVEVNYLWVIAGSLNAKSITDEAQIHPVSRAVTHPEYTELWAPADLAILTTFTRIFEDGKYVARAPIAQSQPSTKSKCVAVGYGDASTNGNLVFVDHKIILEGPDCPLATKALFCAGDMNNIDKSAEDGDSGGPLICDGVITGIVSRSQGPKSFKYYVNVYYYEKWISQQAGLDLSSNLKHSCTILILVTFLTYLA